MRSLFSQGEVEIGNRGSKITSSRLSAGQAQEGLARSSTMAASKIQQEPVLRLQKDIIIREHP